MKTIRDDFEDICVYDEIFSQKNKKRANEALFLGFLINGISEISIFSKSIQKVSTIPPNIIKISENLYFISLKAKLNQFNNHIKEMMKTQKFDISSIFLKKSHSVDIIKNYNGIKENIFYIYSENPNNLIQSLNNSQIFHFTYQQPNNPTKILYGFQNFSDLLSIYEELIKEKSNWPIYAILPPNCIQNKKSDKGEMKKTITNKISRFVYRNEDDSDTNHEKLIQKNDQKIGDTQNLNESIQNKSECSEIRRIKKRSKNKRINSRFVYRCPDDSNQNSVNLMNVNDKKNFQQQIHHNEKQENKRSNNRFYYHCPDNSNQNANDDTKCQHQIHHNEKQENKSSDNRFYYRCPDNSNQNANNDTKCQQQIHHNEKQENNSNDNRFVFLYPDNANQNSNKLMNDSNDKNNQKQIDKDKKCENESSNNRFFYHCPDNSNKNANDDTNCQQQIHHDEKQEYKSNDNSIFNHNPDDANQNSNKFMNSNDDKNSQMQILHNENRYSINNDNDDSTKTINCNYSIHNEECINDIQNNVDKNPHPYENVNENVKNVSTKTNNTENISRDNEDDESIKNKDNTLLIDNLNDYKKIKELGSGSYGTVYLVENIKTHIKYAAKTKNSLHTKQEDFLQEIHFYSHSDFPTILKLYKYCLKNFEGKQAYTMILEYMPNGSLEDLLKKSRKSPKIKEILNKKKYVILYGIIHGIFYLHLNDIIHRDLKPGNILLDENYYPRICDFGSSLIYNDLYIEKRKKQEIETTGTILFMAPEIFIDEKPYTLKVDIYSFAMIAYELLTGNEGLL